MSVFTTEKETDSLTYIGTVDMALHRRGHPWAFTLSLAIVLFFIVVYIWAHFTLLDDVVRGSGKVIPAAGVRDIQSDKGGTISELKAKEGDFVEANQVVAIVANVQDASTLRELQNRSIELMLSLKRLDAQSESLPHPFSKEDIELYPAATRDQIQLYESSALQVEGEDNQLKSQIEQRESEIESSLESRFGLQGKLQILSEKEATMRPAVGRTVSELEFMNMQQEIIALRGELAEIEQTIARAESTAVSAQERLRTKRAERQNTIADELNKNRVELSKIKNRIQTWAEQVSRAELRAPVAGTVKNVLLKEGAVARPADIIMEIISADEVLEIEAKFAPADRGFLYIAQKGMAKFTAYDFSVYGGLQATVIRISDDTIADKRGDPWYEVRLITKQKNIQFRGDEFAILPGMTVDIDLLTDKRSVLDRVLGPLKRAQENAMTEH